MTEYFYNETQHAFAETRIVTKLLTLTFLGPQPMVFKPGMPLEGQVSAMFNRIIPVGKEILENARMNLEFEDQNGIFANVTYDPDQESKVQIFWEAHKIFEKVSHFFFTLKCTFCKNELFSRYIQKKGWDFF